MTSPQKGIFKEDFLQYSISKVHFLSYSSQLIISNLSSTVLLISGFSNKAALSLCLSLRGYLYGGLHEENIQLYQRIGNLTFNR